MINIIFSILLYSTTPYLERCQPYPELDFHYEAPSGQAWLTDELANSYGVIFISPTNPNGVRWFGVQSGGPFDNVIRASLHPFRMHFNSSYRGVKEVTVTFTDNNPDLDRVVFTAHNKFGEFLDGVDLTHIFTIPGGLDITLSSDEGPLPSELNSIAWIRIEVLDVDNQFPGLFIDEIRWKQCRCPCDVNDNNIIDIQDFISVILNWGPCERFRCISDFNLDCQIDINDLLFIVERWGEVCQNTIIEHVYSPNSCLIEPDSLNIELNVCCFPDGNCAITYEGLCDSFGGIFCDNCNGSCVGVQCP